MGPPKILRIVRFNLFDICRLRIVFLFYQEYHLPPDTRPYIGIYYADNIPVISQIEVRLHGNEKLALAINGQSQDSFFLNYTEPQIFKIYLNPMTDCNRLFTMGVEDSLMSFDEPLRDGLSHGFKMYNAHPSGETYFTRTRK